MTPKGGYGFGIVGCGMVASFHAQAMAPCGCGQVRSYTGIGSVEVQVLAVMKSGIGEGQSEFMRIRSLSAQ